MSASPPPTCRPMFLPPDLQRDADRLAVELNPANRPRTFALPGSVGLAARVSKLWPGGKVDLSVQFVDNPTPACRRRILEHANAWGSLGARVNFRETTGAGVVRIGRELGKGYTSYVGTDNLVIPPGQTTMNLEDWREDMPDSWYRRVVRHEFGHALGFEHEHLRQELVDQLDRDKTLAFFRNKYGWTEEMTVQNVLTVLPNRDLVAGPVDMTSVMCYQISGFCTKTGDPIVGGVDINDLDYLEVGKIYQGPTSLVFSLDVASRRLTATATGWGVSAWTTPMVVFPNDFMVMPDRRWVCVPENYLQVTGPDGTVRVDLSLKHVIVPAGWQVKVGVGVYQPGRPPDNETDIVIMAVNRRPTPMVLLPDPGFGHRWRSVV